MSTPRHPGGTLHLSSRPQTQLPAWPPAGAGTTPAAKSASTLPDPAEIAARKQANMQHEREQQRAAVFRRQQQTRDILALLRARWPALFTTPVPLATGIARAIRAEVGYVEVPTAGLGRALHYWTNAPGYLTAVAAGGVRRNLDGTEAGAPDEAQRRFAVETMKQRAAQQARRAASRSPHRSHSRGNPEAMPSAAPTASQEGRTQPEEPASTHRNQGRPTPAQAGDSSRCGCAQRPRPAVWTGSRQTASR